VRDGALHVTAGLSDCRAVHSGLRRQRLQLLVPRPGCISQPTPARRCEFGRRRVECLIGVVEPALRPVEVALGQPRGDHLRRKQRAASENGVGQRVQPVTQDPVLPALPGF
jgi:hypothetical protein